MREAAPTLPVDLDYVPGTQLTVALTVVDAAGNPVSNFVGWTAKSQIRLYPSAAAVLAEWNLNPGTGQGLVVLTAGNPSTAAITLTPALSAGWSWTYAVWDFLLTNPLGQPAELARGTVTLLPPITR